MEKTRKVELCIGVEGAWMLMLQAEYERESTSV